VRDFHQLFPPLLVQGEGWGEVVLFFTIQTLEFRPPPPLARLRGDLSLDKERL